MHMLALDPATGNLPPGVQDATWGELHAAFGSNSHRRSLLDGLRRALENLKAAGCEHVYVDGSFVTAKEFPGDFDACWELAGVDPDLLDPVLLDFSQARAAQNADFGQPKGIVSLDLRRFS